VASSQGGSSIFGEHLVRNTDALSNRTSSTTTRWTASSPPRMLRTPTSRRASSCTDSLGTCSHRKPWHSTSSHHCQQKTWSGCSDRSDSIYLLLLARRGRVARLKFGGQDTEQSLVAGPYVRAPPRLGRASPVGDRARYWSHDVPPRSRVALANGPAPCERAVRSVRTAHRPPGGGVALLRDRRFDRPDGHSPNVGPLVLLRATGTGRRRRGRAERAGSVAAPRKRIWERVGQSDSRRAWAPSRSPYTMMTIPPARSAHHQPNAALSTNPTKMAAASAPSVIVTFASV
jgi:hypothetical protein